MNIQRVLEHWTVAHGIREVIANALDEQALTNSAEPEIFADESGRWHVRDWGRGIRYDHLTQNENKEKLAHPHRVIGKFGVGLKDALATFDRHRVEVTLHSRNGEITIGKLQKHGFEDIRTLHALIDQAADPEFVGTDVVLSGIAVADIDRAKAFFLRFSGDRQLEETQYGAVLERIGKKGRIYVNGLLVAEEPTFLFSYNITSLTSGLRRALNRERSNVGRTAYSDRVKAILVASRSTCVADLLAQDLERFQRGGMHDELQWQDVALHACKILNANEKVIFLTPWELSDAARFVEYAQGDGYRVVIVPEDIRRRLPQLTDLVGNPIRDLDAYRGEWDRSFQFDFVPAEKLTAKELAIWRRTDEIFATAGGRPKRVREVVISETMRLQAGSYSEAVGLWEPDHGRIIVKRSQLASLAMYAGTVLHELVHARTGTADVTMEFETGLTATLGTVATRQLSNQSRRAETT